MIQANDKRQNDAVAVSVVMPVHNGASYIAKAIDSVLIQEVSLELIIIDDGSTDDLAQALAPYIELPNVRLIRNRRNIGVAESRNKGVRAAKGECIAFLDCDDWWEPGKLVRQLQLMQDTGCVLCATARRLVTTDGKQTERIIHVKQRITYRDLLFQNSVNCSSVVVRRDVAAAFPMSHDECHEDYIMWLQILKQYREACAIDEPLLNYRLSDTGKSGNKLKSAKMTYKVYRHMGFGMFKTMACFSAYALNGIRKYYFNK